MQNVETVSRVMPYRFPNDQVIGAQSLKRIIRGAELENRFAPIMEKHSGGDPPRAAKSRNYHPVTPREHMPNNVFEQTKRLRRQAVPSPSEAM